MERENPPEVSDHLCNPVPLTSADSWLLSSLVSPIRFDNFSTSTNPVSALLHLI